MFWKGGGGEGPKTRGAGWRVGGRLGDGGVGRGGGGKHPRPARRLRRLRGSNSGRHSSNRREEADVSVFLPEWCGLGIQPTTHRPVQIAARRIKRRLR